MLVGHEKRYDPGVAFAHDFIRDEIGELIGLKQQLVPRSTYRYRITDTLQPIIESSAAAGRPPAHPQGLRLQRYLVLGHGSHMLNTARFLGGQLEAIRGLLSTKADTHCWFLEVAYANGPSRAARSHHRGPDGLGRGAFPGLRQRGAARTGNVF